ncbi:MAG: DNA mismatch repair endonuclease MutL [Brevinematia bacterium]
MGKIEILKEEVVAKISAGEIIDAPYSVVRELIDNSIDANSSRISVNLIDGGKKLIEVIDDGEGMDKEDLEKCYLRHSTSKIRTIEDLYSIKTMGFRGEALASIAEVSELEIVSKPKHQSEGYKLLIKGGKLVSITPHPSPDGTAVKVKNIFFNLPVRRNFLKSETTEFRNILDVFVKKSIPFPEICFELSHNLKRELFLPKTESIGERIKAVYPEIKELNYSKKKFDEMEIEIFFSKPSVFRPTRNLQQLFVNRRFVESKTFFTAISNAYSNLVPKGNFPIVFCFVSVDPSLIDVNIHPAKKEVKFKNEGKVFHYIIKLIREGISKFDQVLDIDETSFEFTKFETDLKRSIESFLAKEKEVIPRSYTVRKPQSTSLHIQSKTQTQTLLNHFPKAERRELRPIFEEKTNIKFVGEVFHTYLIFEDQDNQKLIIIDKHAVQERIIFSKLYENLLNGKELPKQLLLSPTKVELSREYSSIILENKEVFSKLGFDVEVYESEVNILAIPSFFKAEGNPENIILEICEKIKEGMEPTPENILSVLSTISCKSAIKSGETITSSEAYKLLEDATINNAFVCPHGRPSLVYVDREKLEEVFLR